MGKLPVSKTQQKMCACSRRACFLWEIRQSIYTQQKMRVHVGRACFLLHRQNHSDVTYRWPYWSENEHKPSDIF